MTKEDILKLAKLARLRLTDDEAQLLGSELAEILEYVKMLETVDTEGLKPTTQVTGLVNVTRSDELVDYGQNQEDLLSNFPARDGNYLKAKRMIK